MNNTESMSPRELKQEIIKRIGLIPVGVDVNLHALNLDEKEVYGVFGKIDLVEILGVSPETLVVPDPENKPPIKFMYLNYRGELSCRTVSAKNHSWFGNTKEHKDKQHLLTVFDFDKRALRTFAVSDIKPATN